MKRTLIILFLFAVATTSFSQELPKEIVDNFFIEFETKGPSEAIDNLYVGNKWISNSADAIIQLKNQLSNLTEDYIGKYYGYEFIVEKRLAESFVLLTYMVKYERQPIRFIFQFYKPDKKWLLYSFKFDGRIPEEVEEAAKLYNFRLT